MIPDPNSIPYKYIERDQRMKYQVGNKTRKNRKYSAKSVSKIDKGAIIGLVIGSLMGNFIGSMIIHFIK